LEGRCFPPFPQQFVWSPSYVGPPETPQRAKIRGQMVTTKGKNFPQKKIMTTRNLFGERRGQTENFLGNVPKIGNFGAPTIFKKAPKKGRTTLFIEKREFT